MSRPVPAQCIGWSPFVRCPCPKHSAARTNAAETPSARAAYGLIAAAQERRAELETSQQKAAEKGEKSKANNDYQASEIQAAEGRGDDASPTPVLEAVPKDKDILGESEALDALIAELRADVE